MIIQNTTPVPSVVANNKEYKTETSNSAAVPAQKTTGSNTELQQAVQQSANSSSNEAVTAEQFKEVLDAMNDVVQQSNRQLEFSMDDDSNTLVVKVKNSETGEVIRQIPSEEALAIAQAIDKFQQGILLNQKA